MFSLCSHHHRPTPKQKQVPKKNILFGEDSRKSSAKLIYMIMTQTVCCPYCGERFESNIDVSAGNEDYFEDCQACCRPVRFNTHISPNGELIRVEIRRDDE